MSNTYTTLGLALAVVLGTVLVMHTDVSAGGSPTPGEECVGGEVVGRDGSYDDAVNFTLVPPGTFENWCANVAPAGSCCSFMVDENAGGGGTIPVGVRITMEARSGEDVHVEPMTCGSETPGPNQHNYSCFVAYAPAASAGVTATLVANPDTIYLEEPAQESLLSWGSTGATSCTGTNFSTGGAVAGSLLISPAVTTIYSVSCTNGTQSAQATQKVTVLENPVDPGYTGGDGGGGGGGGGGLTLTSGSSIVTSGRTTVITWAAIDFESGSCTLVGTNGDTWDLTGNQGTITTSKLTSTVDYTLTCTDGDGSRISKKITIRVAPKFEEI